MAAPDAPPPWPRIDSPLDGVNDAFHRAYDATRAHAEQAAPVFVLLGDALIAFHRGARRQYPVTPRAYHAIKSGAHAPVALFAALAPVPDGPLDAPCRARLAALLERTRAALAALPADLGDEPAVAAELRALLDATASHASHTLATGRADRAALERFARDGGPALLRLADHATRLQLAALHACADALLAALTPAERSALQVVVAGAHQARERSVGMQYFRKRLGEPEGAEERVAYAENVVDEDAALALVGTRRLDRAIARAFFGDARRLQRDVLGDAARARLDAMRF